MAADRFHILRRARTAASLPPRIDTLEERLNNLDGQLAASFQEVRDELAGIRSLIGERLATETDGIELVGRLLQHAEARLDALEERASRSDR